MSKQPIDLAVLTFRALELILILIFILCVGLFFVDDLFHNVSREYCDSIDFEYVRFSQFKSDMFYCYSYDVDGVESRSEWINRTVVIGVKDNE